MGSTTGKIMVCGGLLLIAAALCLAGYNLWDAGRAADDARAVVLEMQAQDAAAGQSAASAGLAGDADPAGQDAAAEPAAAEPTVWVDGYEYIGTLVIPYLGLELPVMAGVSDEGLKVAPCRYSGSAAAGDLVVAGHNYPAHFGRISELAPGYEVLFTDAAGGTRSYAVSEVEVLAPDALAEMQAGDWDLTLFTCTLGGQSRVTVRCVRTDT